MCIVHNIVHNDVQQSPCTGKYHQRWIMRVVRAVVVDERVQTCVIHSLCICVVVYLYMSVFVFVFVFVFVSVSSRCV